ncbi:DUF1810 domain-containing protein [Afipia sp. TerB]
MARRFDLQRFIDAQAPLYPRVVAELRDGRKQSHWMWFIFPQIEGLGHSAMAQRYAIGSHDEAVAYLNHPVLGARLRECTALINAWPGRPISQILGHPDDLKFHSSTTLFSQVTTHNREFVDALATFYGGALDQATLDRL